jgi:DNA-binding transcriptional regulator YiaG
MERQHPVVARLAACIDGDLMLTGKFDEGLVWVAGAPVRPSGPDRVACAIARAVALTANGVAALAVPRGANSMPVMLATYLALWRRQPAATVGRLVGSIAVSTGRAGLRDYIADLEFTTEREDAEGFKVGRLITLPVTGERRLRPAALSLDRREYDGLDQKDSWLLFHAPNVAPPLAYNVISAMVVDTVGASPASWLQTYCRNRAARRRQVWVGELGDERFETFCSDHLIPLLRLDWEFLDAAAVHWGTGRSVLASTALAERALHRQALGARLVAHEEVELYLRMAQSSLAQMREKTRGEQPPLIYLTALQAVSLLCRMAVPLGYYEPFAERLGFSDPAERLVEQVEQASASPFRGRWKPTYAAYWPAVKAALRRLLVLLSDPEDSPKWWALNARLLEAQERGEHLRLLVQTRAERLALTEALRSEDCILDAEEAAQLAQVSAFSDRARVVSEDLVTILMGPPPDRHAGIYLAGETDRVEVLCYAHERRRLSRRARESARRAANLEAGNFALDALRLGTRQEPLQIPSREEPVLVVDLDGFIDPRPAPEPELGDLPVPPAPEDEFWDRALELHGTELAAAEEHEDGVPTPTDGERTVSALLLAFDEAPDMYLAPDAEATVITTGEDGEARASAQAARDLQPGARVAVVPGSERGALVAELMAAWDEQLAFARERFMPMYYRALREAIAAYGTQALADHIGVTAGAVRTWERDEARPQQPAHLRALLEASGDQQAVMNQAVIQDFISRTRGAHRLIGRILNETVGDIVLAGGAGETNLQRLRELIGEDSDAVERVAVIFDSVLVLTVRDVSGPLEDVPVGALGSFVDHDTPESLLA